LQSFVPVEIIGGAPELAAAWQSAEAHQIAPYMEKARENLLKAGLKEEQIATKIVKGKGSVTEDIRNAAKQYNCGTIVLGRRGLSGIKELMMGSVTRKILESFHEMAIWIVT
jgi:nucleotide-binding universal stress UspA family protein